MFFLGDLLNKKTRMPTAQEALPGRPIRYRPPANMPSPAARCRAPIRTAWKWRCSHGLFLGRGAPVLADRRRLGDGGRLCWRADAQPDLSRRRPPA